MSRPAGNHILIEDIAGRPIPKSPRINLMSASWVPTGGAFMRQESSNLARLHNLLKHEAWGCGRQ
jgi:hypothetical protein